MSGLPALPENQRWKVAKPSNPLDSGYLEMELQETYDYMLRTGRRTGFWRRRALEWHVGWRTVYGAHHTFNYTREQDLIDIATRILANIKYQAEQKAKIDAVIGTYPPKELS